MNPLAIAVGYHSWSHHAEASASMVESDLCHLLIQFFLKIGKFTP
jgi:hypothetical protein